MRVAFLGWFGPRGLASIVFALVVVEEGRLAAGPLLEGAVVLTVLLSAGRHGACASVHELSPAGKEAMDLPVRVPHAAS